MRGLQIGIATFSEIDGDGFVGVQVDGYGEEKSGLPPFELHHPYGFASRPLDPDADGTGCAALYGIEGNRGFAWLAHDPRQATVLPALRKGESIQYGPKGQFIRCHEDGSISLCTFHEGDSEAHTIFAKLDVNNGFLLETPWGFLRFGPNGLQVQHSSGAKLSLGAIAGIASPLDALTSYFKVSAAIASLEASAVSQGTDAGATNAAAVTQLLAVLVAMAAAVDAKSGSPSAMTALVAAATAQISQLGAVY